MQLTYNYRDRAGDDERYYSRPPWTWPRGIEWLDQCGRIGPALQRRAFSAAEATGIMGANSLGVLAENWGS